MTGLLARQTVFVIACGGCVSTLAAAAAHAQPAAAEQAAPSPDAIARARAHFRAASDHYRAGRFREALRGFELAERLMPGPELWFNIARAHEQLGDIEEAIASYERYVEARGDAADASSVRARIDALRGSLAERPAQQAQHAALRIDAEPGALITLDGESLGVAPIEKIVWVDPGKHVLRAELAGHAAYRAELDAPAGAMVAGSVELVQHSAAPERDAGARTAPSRDGSSRGSASLPAWIASGASVASAIVSGAARASAEASRSDGDRDSADSADTVAGVALASALTSGLLAAVLFFAVPNHVESNAVLQ